MRKARVVSCNFNSGVGVLATATDDGDIIFRQFYIYDRLRAERHAGGQVYLTGQRVIGGRVKLAVEDLVYVSITNDGELIGWCTDRAYRRASRP